MYVWVRGREVGYSEGSKTPAEFRVTDFVRGWREHACGRSLPLQRRQLSRGHRLLAGERHRARRLSLRDTSAIFFVRADADGRLKLDVETRGSPYVSMRLLDRFGSTVLEQDNVSSVDARIESAQKPIPPTTPAKAGRQRATATAAAATATTSTGYSRMGGSLGKWKDDNGRSAAGGEGFDLPRQMNYQSRVTRIEYVLII